MRELRNAIERAAVIAQDDQITVADLPQRVREGAIANEPSRSTSLAEMDAPAAAEGTLAEDDQLLAGDGDLKARVRRHEAKLISAALRRTKGNQTEAARLLGVPVRTLSDKLRRLGIASRKRHGHQ